MTHRDALGVGLFGGNGHQLQHLPADHPKARIVAVAGIDPSTLPPSLQDGSKVRHHASLESLLQDPQVELVSFCSPRRADQPQQCIAALRAGKHVYAEKPCALKESDLDAIVRTANETGRLFHEMAGTAFEEPYRSMQRIVAQGDIGTVVQVLVQKSYPWFAGRPSDEAVDGGLLMQVGVHGVRMIEHVAAQRVVAVQSLETTLGDPAGHGLRMACGLLMELENGGVASLIANYLNPRGIGRWGNEELRIFGTKGMLESTDGGTRRRLVLGEDDQGPFATGTGRDYFELFIDELREGKPMPISLADELHPTRVVIRAKEAAKMTTGTLQNRPTLG